MPGEHGLLPVGTGYLIRGEQKHAGRIVPVLMVDGHLLGVCDDVVQLFSAGASSVIDACQAQFVPDGNVGVELTLVFSQEGGEVVYRAALWYLHNLELPVRRVVRQIVNHGEE